jgi:CheY-like chemotaxis protein
MQAIRALVVDDEKLARDRLIGFLGKVRGWRIVGQATNGVEAVESIERDKPDLVFLDVQMPGMDGFEVLKALRARRRTSCSRPRSTTTRSARSRSRRSTTC